MKFCYVVTTDRSQLEYASAACVSVACVRAFNKDTSVTLVCDPLTRQSLQSASHPVLDTVDEVVVAPTEEADVVLRSRSLKTRLRELVDGDMLCLDCDAFPVAEVALSLHAACDFAATKELRCHPNLRVLFAERGWRLDDSRYFNSGVMYLRDSQPVREVCSSWHQRWREYRDRASHGILGHKDQPSLNSVLAESTLRIEVLPDRFNRQGRSEYDPNAVILHPYSWDTTPAKSTVFEPLIRDVERGREPNIDQMVERLGRTGLEWHEDSWRWQLRERNVGRAAVCLGKKILSRSSQRRS